MRNILLKIYELETKRGFPKIAINDIIDDFLESSKQTFPYNDEKDELRFELSFLELIHYRNNLLWLNIFKKFDFYSSNEKDKLSRLFFDYINLLTIPRAGASVTLVHTSKIKKHRNGYERDARTSKRATLSSY